MGVFSFQIFLWVGPGQRKKILKKENLDLILEFSGVPFKCIFNDFSFYLIFLQKLIYMSGFILLSSLQYFISLERLVTWSRVFLSECILYNLYSSLKLNKEI